MLSILIPIYAFDVRSFVKELHRQALLLPIEWEIILFDDGSPSEWKKLNRLLSRLKNVYYIELTENIGRAAIRNALAKFADFEYLLFMDCDSATADPQFLEKYYHQLQANTVLYGGRDYTAELPEEKSWWLHWYYGSQREVRSVEERQKQAYHGFMTNNFAIPKEIFLRIQLDDRLKQYGHEDTLLGLKLEEEGIPIVHLDNPLLHIGLDNNKEWLSKQEQAIRNLYWLHHQHPKLSTQALRMWQFLHKTGLMFLLYPILKFKEKAIKKSLCDSSNPKLWQFDLLKILWLEEVAKKITQ